MKPFSKLWPFLMAFVFFASCKKNSFSPDSIEIKNTENISPISPFPFDWETADYMPTPPGNPILVPWASGSNKNYNTDIAFDFKKSDGWVLVYNTFNTTALTSPTFFTLYNKYRGILRFYIYLPPTTPTSSTYINHGINVSGSATPNILNYIGQDIVDINTKQLSTTGIQNYQLQSTGGWYVMQYEIAYDPTISTTPYQNLNFQWYSKSVNITQVNLSGAINGTLKGTISQPGSTPSVGGTITQLVSGAYEVTGTTFLGLAVGGSGLTTDVENKLKQSITDGLSSGIVKNIFSALFGGSSGTTQQVDLVLNAQIGLQGSFTNSTGLANPNLVIPGLSGSQTAPGYIPGYDQPLGVFYLSAKPKINITDVVSGSGISTGYGSQVVPHKHTYAINNSSFSVLYNPAVINNNSDGAHIENLKQELFLVKPTPLVTSPYNSITTDGIVEQIGNYTDARSGITYSNAYQSYYPGSTSIPFHQSHGPLAIRISFDIVPNSGAPRTKAVKAFWADQVFL